MSDEIPTSMLDQLQAATREATETLTQVTAMRGGRGIIQSGKPDPLIVDILHQVTMCEHLESPQPVYINWGKRYACCLACAPTARHLPDVDPATVCERCLTEPKDQRFSEFAYHVGPIIVSINICSPCREHVTTGEPILTFD